MPVIVTTLVAIGLQAAALLARRKRRTDGGPAGASPAPAAAPVDRPAPSDGEQVRTAA